MRLFKVCLSLTFLGIISLPVLAKAQTQNNIPFKVCGESNTWVRPIATEQKRHLTGLSSRYSQEVIKELGGDYWKYNIFAFISYPGGSGTSDIENLSGLWKPQKAKHPANCDNYVLELNASKISSIWTLNYKVISITMLNNHYIMQVQQVRKGVQVVQFSRRESLKSLPLTVVNERGQNVPVLFYK